MDIFDSGYTGKIFLYIFCGILDAMWQTTAYWLMGAMSNDPAKLAHFAGFCAYARTTSLDSPHCRCHSIQTNPCNPLAPLEFGAQMQSSFREWGSTALQPILSNVSIL
jgi:hypothetical protein